MNQRYLTERQYAEYTGMAYSTAIEMRVRGDSPPFIRFGANERYSGTIRYDVRDVDAWLDAHRVAPGSEEPGATSRITRENCERRKAATDKSVQSSLRPVPKPSARRQAVA